MPKKKKISVDGSAERVFNPVLGDLLKESGLVDPDAGSETKALKTTGDGIAPEVSAGDLAKVGKIVLRVQRKGRGGKTVTVLSSPGGGIATAMLEPLARDIRKALGCGARVEEDAVILQGDNSERAEKWLRKRGARHIVTG
jgi:translation initiation factor 1